MSRGLKNRNPGNIRRSATTYKGETASTDPAFKAFESMAWGYRAMFVLLHTYRTRYGHRTLRDMIGRYAPPAENNTASYIHTVATSAGISPDRELDTDDHHIMVKVVAGMSRVENGVAAVMPDVEAGWNLFVKYRP